MTFDGSPLKYFEFIRSFDSVIGRSSLDNNTKLLKLYHLCNGAARDVIQCCLAMTPTHGYITARRLLADRFGDEYHISEAWVRRVTDGPAIPNNSKHLRDFADTLNACAETLKALGMINEISNRRELLKIIERLPFNLRSRWLKHVKNIRDNGRTPTILDAVSFIDDAAKELNDPVFGRLLQSGVKDKPHTYRKGTFSTSATSSSSVVSSCILCQADHSLFYCQQFKDMTPDQRFQFAFDKRLCFNCLLHGHTSSQCNLRRTCTVKGCGLKHTKFLHTGRMIGRSSDGYRFPREASKSANQSNSATQTEYGNANADSSSHASCDTTGAGVYRVALPIIPVTVRSPDGNKQYNTYALLDSGSTNSFCLQELADELQVKGKHKVMSI